VRNSPDDSFCHSDPDMVMRGITPGHRIADQCVSNTARSIRTESRSNTRELSLWRASRSRCDLLHARRNCFAAKAPQHAARLHFVRPKPESALLAGEPSTTTVNYFIGNEAHTWRTNVPTYRAVTYTNLFPQIDLRSSASRRSRAAPMEISSSTADAVSLAKRFYRATLSCPTKY
jgi:hypothetical protein